MYGKTNSVVIKADLPTDTLSIVQNGEYDVLNYAKASVNVPGKEEQSKSLDITENKVTTIHPDNGKVLKEVVVTTNIPSIPQQEKTIEITENGTTTVTPDAGKVLSKVTITTNVPQGEIPEKGIIFKNYDSDGYPHNVELKNMTNIPDYYCQNAFINYGGETSFGKNIKNITLPNGIQFIGINAFYGCSSLTNVIIPESVELIQNGVFENCYNLISVNIPSSVTEISYNLFRYCTSLNNIEIPGGITSIHNRAFEGCINLLNITIPSSVTEIGTKALQIGNYSSSGDKNATIIMKPTTPPTIASDTFDKNMLNKIYVPSVSVEAYKTAANWTTFADYIEANPNE